jgi:uncharacterized protein (DUF362 family)
MGSQMFDDEKVSRRKFITRSVKAGVSIAVAGSVSYYLYDSKGPSGLVKPTESISLPDYSISNLGKRMAIIRGSDRAKTVSKGIEVLGGIGEFIKPGDVVLLKVNAAFATPALLSATTHPELISQIIKLCHQAGAKEVRVTDNPINDPSSCFKLTGIEEAVESSGGKLYQPKEDYFQPYSLKGGKLIIDWPLLYQPLKGVNKVIGVAPLKGHQCSGASMTMKNWYGLLGGRRNTFHQDIHTIITELALMMRPTLVILDGTTTMMTNGPTGGSVSDLKNTNTMIVSTDQVAADAFGCSLLDKKIAELPFITKAAEKGAGTVDFESLKPIRMEVV